MYPRTNYEMTQDDLDKILDARKPTPVLYLSGGIPFGGSPQENVNAAWSVLGKRMGFDHMTVQPITGKGNRFFSAIPSENETQRTERLSREGHEMMLAEVKRLEVVIGKAQLKLAALLADEPEGGGGKKDEYKHPY